MPSPAPRSSLLTHVRDVLDRGVDDLIISPFSHLQAVARLRPSLRLQPAAGGSLSRAVRHRPHVGHPGRRPRGIAVRDFFTDFLGRLHQRRLAPSGGLIPSPHRAGVGVGWSRRARASTATTSTQTRLPPRGRSCGIEFQWQRWAREGLADGLLVVAPPPAAVVTAPGPAGGGGLPVLLWRNAAPLNLWSSGPASTREAREWRRRPRRFVVHAMLTVNYADYPERLWATAGSAGGGGLCGLSTSASARGPLPCSRWLRAKPWWPSQVADWQRPIALRQRPARSPSGGHGSGLAPANRGSGASAPPQAKHWPPQRGEGRAR